MTGRKTILSGVTEIPVSSLSLKANSFSNNYPLLDKDGNAYPVINVGNQQWIGHNLMTTKYADGSTIPNISDNTPAWANDTAGAMCYYDNDITYKAAYGALYNWPVIENLAGIAYLERNGIQEIGWKVPSNTDWDNLITYLGGNSLAGGALKETGYVHWRNDNTGATNSSKLSFRGAGLRAYNTGAFSSILLNSYMWSSTISYRLNATVVSTSTTLININLHYGFSIRLVRDI